MSLIVMVQSASYTAVNQSPVRALQFVNTNTLEKSIANTPPSLQITLTTYVREYKYIVRGGWEGESRGS